MIQSRRIRVMARCGAHVAEKRNIYGVFAGNIKE
jgi:hypothetical protein